MLCLLAVSRTCLTEHKKGSWADCVLFKTSLIVKHLHRLSRAWRHNNNKSSHMNLHWNACRKSLLSYVHANIVCNQQHSVPGSADVVVVVITLVSSILKTHAGTTWSVHNKNVYKWRRKCRRNPMAARTANNEITSTVQEQKTCRVDVQWRQHSNVHIKQFSVGHGRNSSTAITIKLETWTHH